MRGKLGVVPTRSCLVCRHAAGKPDLVRFAVVGEALEVDREQAGDGRGAYLCRRPECLDAALRRGGAALLRALRVRPGDVTVEENRLRDEWSAEGQQPVGVGGDTA